MRRILVVVALLVAMLVPVSASPAGAHSVNCSISISTYGYGWATARIRNYHQEASCWSTLKMRCRNAAATTYIWDYTQEVTGDGVTEYFSGSCPWYASIRVPGLTSVWSGH